MDENRASLVIIEAQARERVERQLRLLVDLFGYDRPTLEAIFDGAQAAVMEWVPEEVAA